MQTNGIMKVKQAKERKQLFFQPQIFHHFGNLYIVIVLKRMTKHCKRGKGENNRQNLANWT